MKVFRKDTLLVSVMVIGVHLLDLRNMIADQGLNAGLYRYVAIILLLGAVSFFAVRGEKWALRLFGVILVITGVFEIIGLIPLLHKGFSTLMTHAFYALACIIAGIHHGRSGGNPSPPTPVE
jgi:hypothetical protein